MSHPGDGNLELANAHKVFPGGSEVKASASNAGDPGSIPGQEDPLEKEMATHSSFLAWRIPWTEEPGRLWDLEELDMTERPPSPSMLLLVLVTPY